MRFVDEMPKRVGNFRSSYPWRLIADSGRPAVLVEGEDFYTSVDTVVRAAYQWAKYHDYRVKTRKNKERGEVVVQFFGK